MHVIINCMHTIKSLMNSRFKLTCPENADLWLDDLNFLLTKRTVFPTTNALRWRLALGRCLSLSIFIDLFNCRAPVPSHVNLSMQSWTCLLLLLLAPFLTAERVEIKPNKSFCFFEELEAGQTYGVQFQSEEGEFHVYVKPHVGDYL